VVGGILVLGAEKEGVAGGKDREAVKGTGGQERKSNERVVCRGGTQRGRRDAFGFR